MRLPLILFLCTAAFSWGQATVKSPDDSIEMTISADNGQLAYAVSYRSKPVIKKSVLGLDIQDQQPLGARVRIARSQPGAVDETYTMPHGKSNPVRNVGNTLTLALEETNGQHRELTLEARAYNDGVAFRYLIPNQGALREVRLTGEETEFQLAKDGASRSSFPASARTMKRLTLRSRSPPSCRPR